MFPGVNPREMQKVMKRMGIQQEELDAQEVIIRLEDKDIIISNPQVSKVNMMGQETFQIAGDAEERERSSEPDINDDDVQTVIAQTGASEEQAKAAIKVHKGDLAAAILSLPGNS
ncbi:TPA: nascent polypeptide-associated complex protein [Candidatus Woesearchaeota archaeon]|nr:nascent polypeptide-associated complex protein [Candidatus Woesearchaeota archaeon]